MVKKKTVDGSFKAYLSFKKTSKKKKAKKAKTIYLKEFEITEEDLRVKSASFETPTKIDTSKQMTWINVMYNGKKIYSGNILSSEYDESTGYYKYTTIGHQRWMSGKTYFVANPNKKKKEDDLYKILKTFCKKIVSETNIKGYVLKPKKKYQSYSNNKSTPKNQTKKKKNKKDKNVSDDDNWKLKDGLFYEDKTYYEILMSLVAKTNSAIDMYVDENNILHLDPLKVKSWRNSKGVIFTTDKLKEYTIKQDSTNIITSVLVKTTDIYKNGKVTKPKLYKSKDLIGVDLSVYYGKLSAFSSVEKNTKTVASNIVLARNQITKSMRDLMSFEITFDGYLPKIHTNMFVYFEVPSKHTLSNYSRFVAKIDKTTTRGGKYTLNRFYVEKVTTTYSESGIETKITLNPFASDLSTYSNEYNEAKNAYEQQNCDNNSSNETKKSNSKSTEKDYITVTGKPSTAQASKYYSYKKNYTKTWKNYCPQCKKSGTLTDNPKGVPEHELTCTKSKGGCDADYDVCTGGDKMARPYYLTDVNGKRNTKNKVDKTIGDDKGGSGEWSNEAESSCTSSSSVSSDGKFSSPIIETLANKITKATNETQIMKDLQKMKVKGFIGYHCHSGFCWDVETVAKRGQANCCDGTRLELTMANGKGIKESDLTYVHGHGHVWGRYKGGNVDWLGGANWYGKPWGGNSVSKTSKFPTLPFSNACINPYSHCGADETIEENIGSSKELFKSFNDRLEDEVKDYMEMDFEDMEYYIDKYGGDGNLHGFGNLY